MLRSAVLRGDWSGAESSLLRLETLARYGHEDGESPDEAARKAKQLPQRWAAASVKEECRAVRLELDNRATVASLSEALATGAAEGSLGALRAGSADVALLDGAMARAVSTGCHTVESKASRATSSPRH